jgi:hypothetical protein
MSAGQQQGSQHIHPYLQHFDYLLGKKKEEEACNPALQ